jgi:hypothetical protein
LLKSKPSAKLKERILCEIRLRLLPAVVQQLLIQIDANILVRFLVQASIKRSRANVDVNKLDSVSVAVDEVAIGEAGMLEYASQKKARRERAILKFNFLYQRFGEANLNELAIFNSPTLW